MKLTILHLTDLHVVSRITYEEKKIENIAEIIDRKANSDNVLLLFSGDISFSGEKEQFDVAMSFVDKLIEKTNKNVKVAVCPGNHDRTFGEDGRMTNEVISEITSDNFCSYYKQYKYLNENYLSFANHYVGSFYEKKNDILDKYSFVFGDSKVVVYSLNNSFFSTYHPENKKEKRMVSILPKDLVHMCRGDEDFSVLLMHMPLRDMEDRTYKYIKEKCKKHIDIIVDGHTHQEDFSIADSELIELTSTAMHAEEVSGFSLVCIDDSMLSASLYRFDEDDDGKYVIQGNPIKEELRIKEATKDHFFIG
ncbi:MAG: metallophosphoesterase, partial [Bacteroidales bacterium]|nr:metallophosphoesterase [Bacteroidales bacterium]